MAPITQIQFEEQSLSGAVDPLRDEEKLKARAAKYGTQLTQKDLQKPKAGLVRDELRKSRALQKASDAVTGYDMFSEEEVAKQNARAARYGTAAPAPQIAVAQLPADEDAKRARAAKFGLEYTEPDTSGIDKSLLAEEPREADGMGTLRPEALHVYGVDLIGTKDLLSFFQTYAPTFVEWIDDSSCNVLFPDKFTVQRLLVQMGEAVAKKDMDEMPESIQLTDDSVQHLWYRAKTALVKQGVAVPLLFRLALSSDAKDYMKKRKTRGLWKLPVRQAVAIAQGKEQPPAPELHRKGGKGGQGGHGGGKRTRVDAEGDAIMRDATEPRRKGKRHKHKDDGESGRDHRNPNSFLYDDERQEGAHSFFLADDQQREAAGMETAEDRLGGGTVQDLTQADGDEEMQDAGEAMQVE